MSWRRILFWTLVLAFLWVLVGRLAQVEKLAQVLRQGRWPWIVAAGGLQLLYYLGYTAIFQSAFAVVGMPSRLFHLLPITLSALFVNSTTPSGGAGGSVLYVDDRVRAGYPAARAAVGILLANLIDFGSFCLILLGGLVALVTLHDLRPYEMVAALLLFVYVGGMAALLTMGLRRPAKLLAMLGRIQRWVNRVGGWFRQPTLLRADWAEQNAAEFNSATRAMLARPQLLLRTLSIALLAHTLDLLSLYAVFRAFNVPVTVDVLIAGYAMTVLFLIVSPTPSGIGVVEGVVPLIYTSLGLSPPAATVVVLAFRGLSFWLPMLIGFVLLQRLRTFRAPARSLAHAGQARLVAWLVAGMGVINVLSAVTPALVERAAFLTPFVPLVVRHGGRLTVALAGFALFVLATGLARRQGMAWLLTLAVLLISIVSHLVKGLDWEEASLAALLAGYLVWQRAQFPARSDPPTLRRGVWTVAGALLFTLAYGAAGFYLLDRHYRINFSLSVALYQTVTMFTQFYAPGYQPVTGFGRYFATSIYGVAAVTFAYGLWALLRPVVVRGPATTAERARAQQIVEQYGRSSLARFVLLPDKERTTSARAGRWWAMRCVGAWRWH